VATRSVKVLANVMPANVGDAPAHGVSFIAKLLEMLATMMIFALETIAIDD
jgi:hypothetical protein